MRKELGFKPRLVSALTSSHAGDKKKEGGVATEEEGNCWGNFENLALSLESGLQIFSWPKPSPALPAGTTVLVNEVLGSQSLCSGRALAPKCLQRSSINGGCPARGSHPHTSLPRAPRPSCPTQPPLSGTCLRISAQPGKKAKSCLLGQPEVTRCTQAAGRIVRGPLCFSPPSNLGCLSFPS